MYRVALACHGIPTEHGAEAAADITREFAEHRQWHKNVRCSWDGAGLALEAENDYDKDGAALADEFSDCISAYVSGTFSYQVTIESVTKCP